VSLSLYNHDGTWFKITSPDVPVETIMSEDVQSLDVTEEMAKMDAGSVTLLDKNHVYSRILRPGARLHVSWGIRLNSMESLSRDSVEFMINSPSGGGESNGRISYNCSFMALGARGTQTTRWYQTGTKADVVADALARLGISVVNMFINFSRGAEALSGGTKIAQFESDFRFLVRLADEWRAAFRVGIDRKGQKVACFVDHAQLFSSPFALRVAGASSLHLEYGGGRQAVLSGQANVLSYTWQDHSMDAAQGQGARVVVVDGQTQIYRTVIENETVKTYRLVPERIEAELSTRGIGQRTELLTEYLSAKDFDEVKRFFVEDTTTTAPQGSGLTVEASVMGSPLVTAGMEATFGSGFPDRVGSKDRTWWSRKAQHKIASSGYFVDVSIADAYAFSPTGERLTPVGSTS
jgi:hypothetical protein